MAAIYTQLVFLRLIAGVSLAKDLFTSGLLFFIETGKYNTPLDQNFVQWGIPCIDIIAFSL